MCKQSLTKLTLAAAGLCLAPLLSAQDSEIPRTEYGHPDFQGFYTFRTITPCSVRGNWKIWRCSRLSRRKNGKLMRTGVRTVISSSIRSVELAIPRGHLL